MKIYLSREDISIMMGNLCAQIMMSIQDEFQYVIGIERGGVYISSWLSYVLNKKHSTIHISFRDGPPPKPDDPKWKEFAQKFSTEPLLIVDDIVDSGKTVDFLRQVAPHNKIWIASLHWCQENSPRHKPDFYVSLKDNSDWVVYPWEKEL